MASKGKDLRLVMSKEAYAKLKESLIDPDLSSKPLESKVLNAPLPAENKAAAPPVEIVESDDDYDNSITNAELLRCVEEAERDAGDVTIPKPSTARDVNPPKRRKVDRKYECGKCGKKYGYLKRFQNHVCVEDRKGTCIFCLHGQAQKGKLTCQKCTRRWRKCIQCQKNRLLTSYTKDDLICDSCSEFEMIKIANQNMIGGIPNSVPSSASFTNSTTSALDKEIESIKIDGENSDTPLFFKNIHSQITAILRNAISLRKSIKVSFSLYVTFTKNIERDGSIVTESLSSYFNYPSVIVLSDDDIPSVIENMSSNLCSRIEDYESEKSGWSVEKINDLVITITTYSPFSAGSYIPTPVEIQKSRSVVNIESQDNKCFLWAVLASRFPVKKNRERIEHYLDHEFSLDLSGVNFPTPLPDIDRFEKQNDISVNVFCYEEPYSATSSSEKVIYPRRVTKFRDAKYHVNLLLLTEEDEQHYTLITNLSRLITKNCAKHHAAKFICNYCLQIFPSSERLQNHIPNCSPHGEQRVTLPEAHESTLKFKSVMNQLKVPFIIIFDLETLPEGVDADQSKTTYNYQKHKLCSYCYIVISTNDKYTGSPVLYRGTSEEDVMKHFLQNLMKEKEKIQKILSVPSKIIISDEDEELMEMATHCHICGGLLGDDRCFNHDHLQTTGKSNLFGIAHTTCNLQYRYRTNTFTHELIIPVISHNLSNFDAHPVLRNLGKTHYKLQVIANNMEKYVSFSIDNFRFIDSLQFMNASLDQLVENLKKDDESKFKLLQEHFTKEELPYVLRKGTYMYSYMDSFDKFKESQLPPIDKFYNDLRDEACTEADYKHANDVFRFFNHKNLGDYHDLYLLTDCLLLADVFENFRSIAYKQYGLDLPHYYTLPGYSWDLCFKLTGKEIELIRDYEIYLMFERAIRGGQAVVTRKFAAANNPYLDNYDPDVETNYIIYLDANNLYGHVMKSPMPTGGFHMLSSHEIMTLFKSPATESIVIQQHRTMTEKAILDLKDHGGIGYLFEVDLAYPNECHEMHNDFPLAAESLEITWDMLSPYSRELYSSIHGNETFRPVRKLSPNLFDKKNYVLHFRNLKKYIELGMRVTMIHRVVQFNQEPWLSKFVDVNTKLRQEAKNEFEKNLYKLIINSFFGRSLLNIRKHKNIHLVNTSKKLRKLSALPQFIQAKVFTENLVVIDMRKLCLNLNKPIYIGCCILDLAKLHMYEFHYDVIKKKYGSRAQLLFTDTDSLCYNVICKNIYSDMWADRHLYDFSSFPISHPYHDDTNRKVLGKFKDELHGNPIQRFCGLRAKMYSITDGKQEKKTAKGVNHTVTTNKLKHSHFESALFSGITMTHEMRRIQSRNHQLYTTVVNKVSLCSFDDKRFVLDDKISTLAHGHKEIPSFLQTIEESQEKEEEAADV